MDNSNYSLIFNAKRSLIAVFKNENKALEYFELPNIRLDGMSMRDAVVSNIKGMHNRVYKLIHDIRYGVSM